MNTSSTAIEYTEIKCSICGYVERVKIENGCVSPKGHTCSGETISNIQEQEVENLLIQVKNHIKGHNHLDWYEDLSEEQLICLEDLLLTFNPLCPPGSKGFEEQKRHIAAAQRTKGEEVELFQWVKASEEKPPMKDNRVPMKYDGCNFTAICYRHNTAIWNTDLETWIYEVDFNRLGWLKPAAQYSNTGLRWVDASKILPVTLKYIPIKFESEGEYYYDAARYDEDGGIFITMYKLRWYKVENVQWLDESTI